MFTRIRNCWIGLPAFRKSRRFKTLLMRWRAIILRLESGPPKTRWSMRFKPIRLFLIMEEMVVATTMETAIRSTKKPSLAPTTTMQRFFLTMPFASGATWTEFFPRRIFIEGTTKFPLWMARIEQRIMRRTEEIL